VLRGADAFRYLREGLSVLAGLALTLTDAVQVSEHKTYVTVDGTLLRIDRIGMVSGAARSSHSGKHKAHGVNV
jgi:hypothetical protein